MLCKPFHLTEQLADDNDVENGAAIADWLRLATLLEHQNNLQGEGYSRGASASISLMPAELSSAGLKCMICSYEPAHPVKPLVKLSLD